MKNALDILANLAANRKRRAIFICGDMAELGDSEQFLHRQLGEQIANAGVNLLITLGNLAAIAADAAKTKRPDTQTRCFADQTDLCNNLQLMIKDSDIILVKGSRINKLELVVDKLKKLFSEPR
jgi:UDP-N-acetylmuramoyl-tripeptide--D-alanyl-D-alanine ligase